MLPSLTSNSSRDDSGPADWPALPFEAWRETFATLHRWTQIVGKVRNACTPWINHAWHVSLYLTARGLTTSPMTCGGRVFQIDFDFIDHRLLVQTSDGARQSLCLAPRSVADFYRQLMAELAALGLPIQIHAAPNELVDATPFEQDDVHAAYDADAAQRFWRALLQAGRVFQRFRADFIGKCSPVHFFWGSFDLAVTRFSGRPAPPHPGGVPNCPDWITRDAYSHEVSSCGFWPGSEAMPYAAFYAYAYPEPPGFAEQPVRPAATRYDPTWREFILPYDAVRRSPTPDALLLEFLQDSYVAAAELGGWDRPRLERQADPRRL